MKRLTKKHLEIAVEEARQYGSSFLGNINFDTITDSKKVWSFLKKNGIRDVVLYHKSDDNERTGGNGWFLICPPDDKIYIPD